MENNNKKKCIGKVFNENNCPNNAIDGTEFCNKHIYQKDNYEKLQPCKTCRSFRILEKDKKSCKQCLDKAQEKRDKNLKNITISCAGICRGPKRCTRIVVCDGTFCDRHLFQSNYTKEEMNNLKQCSGCKLMYANSEYEKSKSKQCINCRNRKEIPINKIKKKKKIIIENIICKFPDCKNNNTKDYNGQYMCDAHIDYLNKNIKCVSRYGCGQYLSKNGEYKTCDACRLKDAEKSKKLRDIAKQDNRCTKCHKEYELFNTKKGYPSLKCQYCYGKQMEIEARRDRANRDYSQYDSKPEVKEKKKQWKEDNYDKVAGYWLKARTNKIEENGEDYWKKNSEYAKKWRENNKEHVLETQKNAKHTDTYRLFSLKYEANTKNIEWKLTDDDAKKLINEKCHYCNSTNKYSSNSIDRKNSSEGYTSDNCIPCCSMCNAMKNTLNYYHFLQIIETICGYNKLDANAKINYDNFPNTKCTSYNDYKYRHVKKGYIDTEFITREYYDNIITQNCYICGKQPTQNHINGIDRVDNNIGYVTDNCKPCCSTCNYIKKDFTHDVLMKKIKKIYENIIKTIYSKPISQMTPEEKKNYYRITKQKYRESIACQNTRVKKTKEQLKEEATLRKQKSRQAMKDKYGDAKWREMRALEKAIERAKKNQDK